MPLPSLPPQGSTSWYSWAGSIRIPADPTGATDIMPLLQQAYDNGSYALDLDGGGTYLINSAFFADSTNNANKVVIDFHGAKVIFGANLPRIADFYPDTAVRGAFFPNTKRTALSGGVVTCNGNQVVYGAAHWRLVIKNAIVDASSQASANPSGIGLVFGNGLGSWVENINATGMRFLLSAIGYSDAQHLHRCYTTGGVADSWMLYQIDNGDAVVITGSLGHSDTGIASLNRCLGAVIDSVVGAGIRVSDCRAINIRAAHLEAAEGRSYACIQINNSEVFIDSAFFDLDKTATAIPCIEINDTAGESHSDVKIRGGQVWTEYISATDPATADFLRITAANTSTRVTVDQLTGAMTYGLTQVVRNTAPTLSSAVTAIQTAINAGQAFLATGRYQLTGKNNVWTLTGLAVPGLIASHKMGTPSITQIVGNTGSIGSGTLTVGTTYSYAMAFMDAAGNYGAATAEFSTAAGSAANLTFTGETNSGPGRLVIWRKTGTGVLTAPDHYIVLPWDSSYFRFFDTGANINQRPWLTTSIPVPSTVAATDHTVTSLTLT